MSSSASCAAQLVTRHPAAAAAHLLAPRDVAPGPGLLQAAAVQVAEGGGQRLYARPLLVLLTHTTIIYFKILFIYIIKLSSVMLTL